VGIKYDGNEGGGLYFIKLLEAVQRLPLLGDKLERWFSKDSFLCLASILYFFRIDCYRCVCGMEGVNVGKRPLV